MENDALVYKIAETQVKDIIDKKRCICYNLFAEYLTFLKYKCIILYLSDMESYVYM